MYVYDSMNFNGLEKEFMFNCKKHGDIKMIAKKHYIYGCRYCKSGERFIEKSRKIHNDKYSYSSVFYENEKIKVKIICEKHGEFFQKPAAHIIGQGCPDCKKLDINELILKINKKHFDNYNTENIIYKNAITKFKVKCKKHGEFYMCPKNLSGCKKCANEELSHSTKEFIEKSNIIFNNKYDYSKTNYINNKSKVIIICSKHGVFEQRPDDHLNGHGCKFCKISLGEELISNILKSKNIGYVREHKFKECKNIRELPFDFYIESHNLCIEYHGKQHYEPINFFGGIKTLNKTIFRDNIKINFCKDNNIKLLIIKYDSSSIKESIETILNEPLQ